MPEGRQRRAEGSGAGRKGRPAILLLLIFCQPLLAAPAVFQQSEPALDRQSEFPSIHQSYLRGTGLSGSVQGSGGVVGVPAIERHTGPNAGVHFVSHDGSGYFSGA